MKQCNKHERINSFDKSFTTYTIKTSLPEILLSKFSMKAFNIAVNKLVQNEFRFSCFMSCVTWDFNLFKSKFHWFNLKFSNETRKIVYREIVVLLLACFIRRHFTRIKYVSLIYLFVQLLSLWCQLNDSYMIWKKWARKLSYSTSMNTSQKIIWIFFVACLQQIHC